jgi:hypothetical protein
VTGAEIPFDWILDRVTGSQAILEVVRPESNIEPSRHTMAPPAPRLTPEEWRRVDELSKLAAITIQNRINVTLWVVPFGRMPTDVYIESGASKRIEIATGEQSIKVSYTPPPAGLKDLPLGYESNKLRLYLSAKQYFFICSWIQPKSGLWNKIKQQFQPDFLLELSHTEPWPELMRAGITPDPHKSFQTPIA